MLVASSTRRNDMKKQLLFPLLILAGLGLLYSCATYTHPDKYGFTERSDIQAHQDEVLDIDLSADGRFMASAALDGTVKLWDARSYEELRGFEGHPAPVNSLSLNADGSLLVTGCRDGALRIYRTEDAELLHTMRGHAEDVFTVAFSPDGEYVLSGGRDGTLRYWRAADGELLKVLRGHSRTVNAVVFSSDGSKAYSASLDGSFRSWYLGDELAPGFVEKINSFGLLNLDLHPSGDRIALIGIDSVYDSTEKSWQRVFPVYLADIGEIGTENIETRDGHSRYAWALAWSPDGSTVVSGGNDRQLFFRDGRSPLKAQKVYPRIGSIWDVEYSPDGDRVFVAGADGRIAVFGTKP